MLSLNIEGKRHLEKVRALIAKENPDLVALMEVCEEDLEMLAGGAYPYIEFASNDLLGNNRWDGKSLTPIGVALVSKHKLRIVERMYPGISPREVLVPPGTSSHAPVVLLGEVELGGEYYKVGAVHFTWTKAATISDEQRRDIKTMLENLEGEELVLMGDFNLPRGNELYKNIVEKYKDNIPAWVETTLDPNLHYANLSEEGRLKLVVDYVFSTEEYEVENLRVVSGVSDHCAIVCTIYLV